LAFFTAKELKFGIFQKAFGSENLFSSLSFFWQLLDVFGSKNYYLAVFTRTALAMRGC